MFIELYVQTMRMYKVPIKIHSVIVKLHYNQYCVNYYQISISSDSFKNPDDSTNFEQLTYSYAL